MTAQIPDVLLIDGQYHKLFTNPLDHMPADRRRGFRSPHTANWRGYVALWAIDSGRLCLKDIDGEICTRPLDPGAPAARCGALHRDPCQFRAACMADFADETGGPLLADWFSGELVSPQGKLLSYEHMGYNSRYERYLIIEVARGQVLSQRVEPGEARHPPIPRSEPDLRRRLLDAFKRGLR